MKRIDYWFVLIGACYGTFGMIFGIWMGITQSLNYVNTHAHIGLVGFVIFVLFGLIYRAWPQLKPSRIAMMHFGLANLAAPVFLYGKFTVDSGGSDAIVATGALLVIASMIALLANLAMAGRESTIAPFATPAE